MDVEQRVKLLETKVAKLEQAVRALSVQQNNKKAYDYYKKAADQGDTDALKAIKALWNKSS